MRGDRCHVPDGTVAGAALTVAGVLAGAVLGGGEGGGGGLAVTGDGGADVRTGAGDGRASDRTAVTGVTVTARPVPGWVTGWRVTAGLGAPRVVTTAGAAAVRAGPGGRERGAAGYVATGAIVTVRPGAVMVTSGAGTAAA